MSRSLPFVSHEPWVTGVDVNEAQNDGSTPLHFAAMEGNIDVVCALNDNGADLEVGL